MTATRPHPMDSYQRVREWLRDRPRYGTPFEEIEWLLDDYMKLRKLFDAEFSTHSKTAGRMAELEAALKGLIPTLDPSEWNDDTPPTCLVYLTTLWSRVLRAKAALGEETA